MEIQLRVVLLVVGVLILLIVGIDIYRRRPLRQTAVGPIGANNSNNELLSSVVTQTEHESAYVELENQLDLGLQGELDQIDIALPQEDSTAYVDEEPLPPENIITVSLLSRARFGFPGGELLQALNSAHLYFGKNDIFHRHEHDDGTGAVLFSLVKSVEPGYFHIDMLTKEHVPGVTMILRPSKVINPAVALDKMVRAAKQMAFTLNAELLDHERKPLTLTTIEKYRNQLR